MNNNKSLGSSPIGYSNLGNNSFKFIRDLGVTSETRTSSSVEPSNSNTNTDTDTDTDMNRDTDMEKTPASQFSEIYTNQNSDRSSSADSKKKKQADKKIVSYYLDRDLIDRLKALADDQNAYYSAVVSSAIEFWIEKHGY